MTSDLARAADRGFIYGSADPGEFIIRACTQGAALLRGALANGDIDQVAAVRSQAEAVRAAMAGGPFGRDARLAVAGLARRADRALGLAIRAGQENGTITRPGAQLPANGTGRRPVTDFASYDELSPGGAQPGLYDLADGVTDEGFEAALAEARAEGNLSRANVARKTGLRREAAAARDGEWVPVPGDHGTLAPAQRRKLIGIWAGQGHTSRQIAGRLGIREETVRKLAREGGVTVAADDATRRTRRHDSVRIARETVHALEGLAMGAGLVDFADIDPAEAKDWATSLTESLRALNRFTRQIKEIVPSE